MINKRITRERCDDNSKWKKENGKKEKEKEERGKNE